MFVILMISMTIKEMYENGFLMLPDFITEYLLKSNLMTYKGRVLLAIFMRTLRYKRIISRCPVQTISDMTRITRRNSTRAIEELVNDGIIKCIKTQGKYMEVEIIPEKIIEIIDKMSENLSKSKKLAMAKTCIEYDASSQTEHASNSMQVVVQHASNMMQVGSGNENFDKHASNMMQVEHASNMMQVSKKHASNMMQVCPPSLDNIKNNKKKRAQGAPPTPPKKGGILFLSFLKILKIPIPRGKVLRELMEVIGQYTVDELTRAGQNLLNYYQGTDSRLYVLSLKLSTIQANLGEFMNTEKVRNRIEAEKRAYQDRITKDSGRGPKPVKDISSMSPAEQLDYYEGKKND